jgi:hypothetical protein
MRQSGTRGVARPPKRDRCGPTAAQAFARMTVGVTAAELRNEALRHGRAAVKEADSLSKLLLEARALRLALTAKMIEVRARGGQTSRQRRRPGR